MARNTLQDLEWDSATPVKMIWGTHIVQITKSAFPKFETKVSKIKKPGQGRSQARTIGTSEVADMSIEMTLLDYTFEVLPFMPVMGGNEVEFVITGDVRHVSVRGSYSTQLDRCRILTREGPEWDGSEKEQIMKIGVSVMNRWEKGPDGVWKCPGYESALPSSLALALRKF